LWSSSLCKFVQPPAALSHVRSKYSHQHLVFKHPQSKFFPDRFSPIQKRTYAYYVLTKVACTGVHL
jgi:hypothetical protein